MFLLPLLVIFGLFAWFPILRAFVMSVQDTNLVSEPIFVGLENFQRVLADPLFGIAVRNTAWFAFLALVFGFPIPIILAVLMSEVRRHRGIYSALAYLPVVVPPVVVGPAVALLLRRVAERGLQHDPRLVRARPVAVAPERRHGHAVDRHRGDVGRRRRDRDHLPRGPGRGPAGAVRRGRGRWRVHLAEDPVRHAAAAPRTVLFLTLILQLIATAQLFTEPLPVHGGGPANSTMTVLLLIYKYAFQNSLGGDYGMAAALSLMLAAFLAVFTAGYYWLTRRWSVES